ncbi:MAG: phosphoribosylformimino-5-aminoimidazole carboxamide ribotide isomerase [Clostridiales bacterium]|jgi:phosphoribosylformimino-5-aminoimidazole carboxamide ribotide isomerase|nr:phosphoribosylformimino-5-aminoimidazole carboxamide ribotide isomerase [Clostridiales bacterium]
MKLYPAIDLYQGKCVRLEKGAFDKSKTYYENPLDAAKYWEDQGSDYIHIIDLDGSKDGQFVNFKSLVDIVQKTSLKVQFGGGIRSMANVETLANIGVDRIIIGSLAIKQFELFKTILSQFGEKIVCAIDAKGGYIATDGWTEISEYHFLEFAKLLDQVGCSNILYTDISRDGMLTGPDLKSYQMLKVGSKQKIVASGGVSSLDDLRKLSTLNLDAVIVGKAFYENAFTFDEAIKALQEETND